MRSRLVACVGTIGSIIGSLALYQMFFADFINILGAIAPPVCAPILADYFIISREKYDIRLLEKHPAFRWAGVISFIVGGAFGYLFQYVWKLPGDLPSGLVAMLIAFVLYDVLVVDLNTVVLVDLDDLGNDVLLYALDTADFHDIVRIDRAICQQIARFHKISVVHQQRCAVGARSQ